MQCDKSAHKLTATKQNKIKPSKSVPSRFYAGDANGTNDVTVAGTGGGAGAATGGDRACDLVYAVSEFLLLFVFACSSSFVEFYGSPQREAAVQVTQWNENTQERAEIQCRHVPEILYQGGGTCDGPEMG